MPKGNRGGKNGATTGYYRTVDRFEDAKVIEPIEDKTSSLPRRSHSPNAIYIYKNKKGEKKSVGFYNKYRELEIEINIDHGHIIKHHGKTVGKLKKGIPHIHFIRGGRNSNTRYLTKKESKKYGKYISFMKGK
ncbi:MAG: hypothetical protein IKD72_04255 [Clostridia bacterium]|nr:hypothetical protein [Clostridia bacterium]